MLHMGQQIPHLRLPKPLPCSAYTRPDTNPPNLLICKPVANKSIDSMITRTEASQLHFLAILNLLCIAISPFHWHFRVSVRVDQDIECAVSGIELREKSHRSCDLAENGLDLELNFFFCLFRRRFGNLATSQSNGTL